jgi:hypothetical protein
MNLNEEAENYSRKMWGVYYDDKHPDSAINDSQGEISILDFTAGVNSKYVQTKILQAQIDILKSIKTAGFEEAFICIEIYNKVKELEKQLESLNNG